MWEHDDYNGYMYCKQKGIGQVKDNDILGCYINLYCNDLKYKTFLEIGTWNGLGSTKCFVDNLIKREDDWVFYSLESNKEKSNDAKTYYKNIPKVHILNEVIWNETPTDFYEVFPDLKLNETCVYWHKIDMENAKLCNIFLDRTDLPDKFDLILFDGGEFTTYHEFEYLQDRAKTIILDDINTSKCDKIAENLRTNSQWKVIADLPQARNGILIAEKIIYT
jgi:hypothetical protein